MEIQYTPRTRRTDSGIVPMINVVFLLMIFFLMSTTLSPETTGSDDAPASASAEAVAGDKVLVVDADGTLAWGALRGDAVLPALEAAAADGRIETLMIQADRGVPAVLIARLMGQLGDAGIRDSALVTAGR
ncbi:MAG: biopolymer transporter ExbD [Pseudomonadota bacterium]